MARQAKVILYLIRKELLLEWRSRYAINGLLLYAIACVFICYLSFKRIDPLAWNALFWIILLFAAVNAVAKSFMLEKRERFLYYYQVAAPSAVILSKISYNALLMVLLSGICFFFYSVVLHNPVQDLPYYLLSIFVGAVSLSSVLTMVSGIAAKANNSATLMTVLSFPVMTPVLLLLIRLSKNAMDGLDRSVSTDELLALGAINAIVLAVSLVLFPYLWRD